MGSSVYSQRFLTRLQAPGQQYEYPYVEQVLAVCRLVMGSASLVVDITHPLAPEPYNQLPVFFLVVYCVESLGLLIWLLINTEPDRSFVKIMQISDVFWPIILCLFADPPNSQVFVFFLFALLTAAFRYGLPETMFIGLLSTGTIMSQTAILAFGPKALARLVYAPLNVPRLVLRCTFLLMTAFLLGYLAEREKEQRAEIAFTNNLLAATRVGSPMGDVLAGLCESLVRVFQGDQLYAAFAQTNSGRVFRWDVDATSELGYHVKEIGAEEHGCDLLLGYPHTFFMRKTENGGHSIDALDDEGRPIKLSELQELAMPVRNAASVLAVKLVAGREWNGRFVLINGQLGLNRDRELRFLQNVLRQIAPVLYSVYLFRRLRSRAGAMERAKVARELHDTSIQSLISIEMQVDVLRRTSNGHGQPAELERIQKLLREEVLNLRELMQSLRPLEVGPQQFLDFTAQLVERFRSDTGVDARFVSELEEVTLPASACRELARVVQEGLVNIRKHSGASSVYVRFGAQNGLWKLVIDDDGKGFPFSGRLSLSELDDLHRGPAVIKERVRAIGGDMVIESSPGHGARLEVTVPQKGHELYG